MTTSLTKKIIVLEDDPDLRMLLEGEFSSQGYETFQANNANKAKQLLNNHSIDFLLTNLMTTEADATQLINWLHKRSHEKNNHECPKIIVLTAEYNPDITKHLYEIGADKVLIKSPQVFAQAGYIPREFEQLC